MQRRFYILLTVMLSVLTTARAQYDPSFSHYWAIEPAYNPAAAGKQSMLNVAGVYNMTLAGFEHNPRTMYIGADMPFYALKSYHGVGLQLMNDDIGAFSHKRFAAQYVYRFKLLGGMLGVGLQGGLLSENLDGGKIDLRESGDPAFSTSEANGTGVDLGAGLYYVHRQWYVGVSAQHLNQATVELGEANEIALSATYYLTGGYNIRLRNPFLSIHTSVLGRTDGVTYRADLTGRVKYTHDKKVMYAGLSYSPGTSVTLLIGGNFHGITLGYSYEAYTTAINIGNGSHELYVGYQTDINLYKKGRNRHQSVRIL